MLARQSLRTRHWTAGLLAVAFVASVGGRDCAAGYLYASVDLGETEESNLSPVSATGSSYDARPDGSIFASSGTARAGWGILGASAYSLIDVPRATQLYGVGTVAGRGSHARFAITDLVITGPEGPVQLSLNMNVTGGLDALARATGAGLEHASARASMEVQGQISGINGGSFSGSMTLGSSGSQSLGTTYVFDSAGVFDVFSDEFSGAGLVASPTFLVEANRNLSLQLGLDVAAVSQIEVAGTSGQFPTSVFSQAQSDFSHTVSFSTTGPVFNLPDGYTANSASGMIVNNRWVGAPAAAVPEPASMTLLGIGVAGLVGFRVRRTRPERAA